MTHPSWEPAVAALRLHLGSPDASLVRLAARLDLVPPSDWPAMVVAAWIREQIDPILSGRPVRDPSQAQLEFLARLASEAGATVTAPSSVEVASAWIDVFLGRRTASALESLKLQRDDVCDHRRVRDSPDLGRKVHVRRIRVSSLRDDGLVYFRGGNGKCGWPSSLRLVARAGTSSARVALEEQPGFWVED